MYLAKFNSDLNALKLLKYVQGNNKADRPTGSVYRDSPKVNK